MEKRALDLAIDALKLALSGASSVSEINDIYCDAIMAEKENSRCAQASHLAVHFVVDVDLRDADTEYASAYEAELQKELYDLLSLRAEQF
jgi:hypothetical protein